MSVQLPRGRLIAFEGIDGSGKSTQAELLALVVEQLLGLPVVRTKEPTAGPWGQRLRDSQQLGRLSPTEELELFLRDRRDHVETLIGPALARGELVIVDRYYYSTAAYQGARGVAEPAELIRRNREFAPKPDLVVLVDVEARIGLGRIRGRGLGQDSFESLENLERCRQIFLGIREPHILVVEGQQPPLVLLRQVVQGCVAGPLSDFAAQSSQVRARLTRFDHTLSDQVPGAGDGSALRQWLVQRLSELRRT